MRNEQQVADQFADWLQKKASKGLDFNQQLYSKREFYNPSLVSKLLEYAGLRECQTNLPKELFDPQSLPPFDFERVSENQRREHSHSSKGSSK